MFHYLGTWKTIKYNEEKKADKYVKVDNTQKQNKNSYVGRTTFDNRNSAPKNYYAGSVGGAKSKYDTFSIYFAGKLGSKTIEYDKLEIFGSSKPEIEGPLEVSLASFIHLVSIYIYSKIYNEINY